MHDKWQNVFENIYKKGSGFAELLLIMSKIITLIFKLSSDISNKIYDSLDFYSNIWYLDVK